MREFAGRIAVVTGAASGIGLELARVAASRGMHVVMADVQTEALDRSAAALRSEGARITAVPVDTSDAGSMRALAGRVDSEAPAPHLVFNNAGVGTGGLIWEQSLKTWEWVVGVNLFGVAHGIREFVPRMLAAAQADANYEGHVVNTASMAGLVNVPNMGAYNVTKHAVVSLSETLFHDLALVCERVHAHVLCPYFVPTAIAQSERNRPSSLTDDEPHTRSQDVARMMTEKAVRGGHVTAADVATLVFDAIRDNRFYIYSHPNALGGLRTRFDDILQGRNPTDPFRDRPDIGVRLREALTNRR
ncbi:MAG: SDR family oxidoreductase [Proteobacteria bacterium]|nr:SDR family oxidoreductase [Pseudomonadota bacterium]